MIPLPVTLSCIEVVSSGFFRSYDLISHPENSFDIDGVFGVRLQLAPQTPDRVVHGVGA